MISFDTFKPLITRDVHGVNDYILDDTIREVLIDFCTQTGALKKSFQASLTAGTSTNNYLVDVDLTDYVESVDPLELLSLIIDGTPWFVRRLEVMNAMDSDEMTNNIGDSEKFWEIPEPRILRLFPIKESGTGFFKMSFVPKLDATKVDDKIYYNWRTGIACGVKSLLCLIPDEPYTDPKRAAAFGRMYEHHIQNARGVISRGFSPTSLQAQPREFGF